MRIRIYLPKIKYGSASATLYTKTEVQVTKSAMESKLAVPNTHNETIQTWNENLFIGEASTLLRRSDKSH
jgi:hypothetical protein